MKKINCIVCGNEFEIENKRGSWQRKICSKECKRKRKIKHNKKYYSSDKGKLTIFRYTHSEKGKLVNKKGVKKWIENNREKYNECQRKSQLKYYYQRKEIFESFSKEKQLEIMNKKSLELLNKEPEIIIDENGNPEVIEE